MTRRHAGGMASRRPLLLALVLLVLFPPLSGCSTITPWPGAMLIRMVFDREGEKTARALEKHVPPHVADLPDQHYDPSSRDAWLDVFRPEDIAGTPARRPLVVWIHGGAWVSGSRKQVANYARVLAGRGYVVAAIDYSRAPGSRYPVPVRQANTALGWLAANAERLNIDTARIVLAGDSAGAQMTAQLANAISEPSYAAALGITPAVARAQLAGVLLYCGSYDLRDTGMDKRYAGFVRTVLWSYSGTRHFMSDAEFATASVLHYVGDSFPPAFITVGNDDPLVPQSRALADTLTGKGVPVDTLFFPDDHEPRLPHEYQFNLDSEAGRLALSRALDFLARHAGAVPAAAPGGAVRAAGGGEG